MKRFLAIFISLFVFISIYAQSENSIVIDGKSFRAVQSDALTGVSIDKIAADNSRRPCARIKIKINRMSREDIDKIDVKVITNNQLTKCKTADYENGLILEMTAKEATRFYFNHPEFGQSNEVMLNLEANREYYMEASLNQTYSIVINSNITDAEVYLDGDFCGRTDSSYSCTVKSVMVGAHELKVVYGGITHTQKIDVNSGSILFRQNVDTAASEPQFVVFIVEPTNAVVLIDNQPYSLQDGAMQVVLDRGTYNYVVTAAGYHSQSGTFAVAGEKVEKRISLAADAVTVTLTAPNDAEIWVNGVKKGNGSWSGTLNSGNYIFEARKAGHTSSKISQHITSDSAKQSFDLPAPTPIYGSLVVSGTPISATVTLDGSTVGSMPLKLNQVLVGNHVVRVACVGYNSYKQSITIAEGKTTTVNVALDKHTTTSSTTPSSTALSSTTPSSTTKPATPKSYKIGDIVEVDGVHGVVCQTSPQVKVISVAEGKTMWNSAFKWCTDLGEGWYLPSYNELKGVLKQKDVINNALKSKGLPRLGASSSQYSRMWSSTKYDSVNAYFVAFSDPWSSFSNRQTMYAVRAMKVIY